MANYSYDESGSMAAYYVLTFLSLFLVPYTLVAFSTSSMNRQSLRQTHILISISRTSITVWLPVPAVCSSARTDAQARAWHAFDTKVATTVCDIRVNAT